MKQRIIVAGGKRGTIKAWAKLLGVTTNVIHARLHAGWTEAQAVGVDPSPAKIKSAVTAARNLTR